LEVDPCAYFFVIQWPDREHDDPDGTLFPSDRAARKYADRIIRELKSAEGYDDPGLTMIVKGRRPENGLLDPVLEAANRGGLAIRL